MHKGGQFFLIAALVIVGIIAGLSTIYVTTRTPPPEATVYDLSKEISSEGSHVIDNGVFKDKDIINNIEELARQYLSSNPDSDINIIYGDKNSLFLLSTISTSESGSGISTGGAGSGFKFQNKDITTTSLEKQSINGDTVAVDINNQTYHFDLSEGQTFYVVVVKETGEETIVAAG